MFIFKLWIVFIKIFVIIINIAKIKFESRIIYVNPVIIVTMSVDKTASKNGKIDSYGKIKSPRNNYGSQQTVVERDT